MSCEKTCYEQHTAAYLLNLMHFAFSMVCRFHPKQNNNSSSISFPLEIAHQNVTALLKNESKSIKHNFLYYIVKIY